MTDRITQIADAALDRICKRKYGQSLSTHSRLLIKREIIAALEKLHQQETEKCE